MEGGSNEVVMDVTPGGGLPAGDRWTRPCYPLLDRYSIIGSEQRNPKNDLVSMTGPVRSGGTEGSLGVRYMVSGGWLVDVGQWPPSVHLLVPWNTGEMKKEGDEEKEGKGEEKIGDMKEAFLDRGRLVVSIEVFTRKLHVL
jgi:hypothetical protein